MFFKEKMLVKDQLEYSLNSMDLWNSTNPRNVQIGLFVFWGCGVALDRVNGEYDNVKDGAEILSRK